MFGVFVLAVVAYLIGALPLGYWTVRALSGKDPRYASAYNLGLENSIRLLGAKAVLGAFLADLVKGYTAVYLARPFGVEAALLYAALAYLGHLFPPPRLGPKRPLRARGAGVLLGVLSGLSVAGLAYAYAFIPVVVGLVVYAATGYASLAALSLPVTLAVVVSLLDLPSGAKAAAWVLAGLAFWRYKENLGRILDGIEPRLGEPLPLQTENQAVCAFMIHPMTIEDFWQSPRFAWLRPLVRRGWVKEAWVERLAEWIRPMKVGELRGVKTKDGREVRCYLISAPLLPHQIVNKPELATRRAIQAARLARELGATAFGLGAFWSVVGEKGVKVQEAVPEIHITNGGAYTAGTIKASIPKILERYAREGRDLAEVTAAVVGANGVVAFGIARQIAPLVGRLILVGRNAERLARSANTLRRMLERQGARTEVIETTEIARIKEAELIFTATSDPNPVIYPEHVREGAWIYDEGRPADVHPDVAKVPGVRVIPGGVVRPPGGMRGNLNLHFGEGQVPACLAETMIMAVEEAWDRASLGSQTKTENINFYIEKAAELGFEVVD